ncbi:hypothetical protein QCA50_001304 [Cerrena zonata]|uniref:Uncharacterized protein n=1 Tax=Cerrena zonata TaxID=2478898 RepID=A0AAW0H0X2_9APHY
MFNNSQIIAKLGATLDGTNNTPHRPSRRKLEPSPCLIERLPLTAFIQREARSLLPKAELEQIRRELTPPEDDFPDDEPETMDEAPPDDQSTEPQPELSRKRSVSSIFSTISARAKAAKAFASQNRASKPWRDPEPYEVFSAIERKDIMYLMEIRDRAFYLLVRKSGGATPLLHTMRIGKSHQDVAIILLGAFSRYVNQLQDEDMSKPGTKVLLKALRANLKLAIDYGLQTQQSDLIASFLQTLIMSEGENWVVNQVIGVGLALRSGPEGKPVSEAESAVRNFATKELGKAKVIATLEDYIANATADLLMMAVWASASDVINIHDPIPVSDIIPP